MRHRVSCILSVLLLMLAAGPALAQSEHGEQDKPADDAWVKQTVQTCAACHGKTGVAPNPTFPVLAGQYENYLLHALKAYRSGDRKNAIMAGQIQGMTDAQFAALARYFSNQQTPLHTPYVED